MLSAAYAEAVQKRGPFDGLAPEWDSVCWVRIEVASCIVGATVRSPWRLVQLLAWGLVSALAAGCVAGESSVPSSTAAQSAPAAAVTASPTGSPAAGESVVAWVDQPAPHYVAPSPSLPPHDARPCQPADLRATTGAMGAGLGNTDLPVTFLNRSTSACALTGYPPTLAGVAANGSVVVIAARHGSYFGDPGPPANIGPGESAALNISGGDNCPAVLGGEHRVYPTLRVGLPDGGTLDVAGGGFDTACGVSVSRFGVPADANPQAQASPLPLTATITAPPTVLAGTTLRYLVTLSNPTDAAYPLSPCPSYEEFVGSGSADRWVTTIRDYYLNCAATAVLAPGASVRFEMWLAIPADQPSGFAKFGWDLQGDRGPWANAPMQVQPAT